MPTICHELSWLLCMHKGTRFSPLRHQSIHALIGAAEMRVMAATSADCGMLKCGRALRVAGRAGQQMMSRWLEGGGEEAAGKEGRLDRDLGQSGGWRRLEHGHGRKPSKIFSAGPSAQQQKTFKSRTLRDLQYSGGLCPKCNHILFNNIFNLQNRRVPLSTR